MALGCGVACSSSGADDGDSTGTTGDSGGPTSTSTATTTGTASSTTSTASTTTSTASTTTDPSSTTDVDPDSTGQPGDCIAATLLWSEDWETGDYSRWTSMTYDAEWNGGVCHDNGFSTEDSVSPGNSHRSEVTCESGMDVHRGYGGLQFDGDAVVPAYTNQGEGIDAPFGVVNTFWSRVDVPYAFENGRWLSFWTVNDACDYSSNVLTLGLENVENVLTPAHVINNGGTVEFDPNAPAYPFGVFTRITIYVNYHDGVLHVWQDGASVVHATFDRPGNDMCQWHWGLYASGDNTDIVMFEDDNSLWKLGEAWTDFTVEPWIGESIAACE
jgi:hypothetical protein